MCRNKRGRRREKLVEEALDMLKTNYRVFAIYTSQITNEFNRQRKVHAAIHKSQ
jgi:hypothetical protein